MFQRFERITFAFAISYYKLCVEFLMQVVERKQDFERYKGEQEGSGKIEICIVIANNSILFTQNGVT